MILIAMIFVAAVLYASVGHAGASGYLAAMALMNVEPTIMKPVALTLNILVATIASYKFYRVKRFSWPIFWPFAIASVPMAFIGGAMQLPLQVYKPAVGVVLILSATRLLWTAQKSLIEKEHRSLSTAVACSLGAVIGLLSGATGVGGGIFLTPLLLFMGWANTKDAAGISAAFILVNSISGLAGHFSSVATLPGETLHWAVAAGIGGWIGAEFGSKKLSSIAMRRMLALVLAVAGIKMAMMK